MTLSGPSPTSIATLSIPPARNRVIGLYLVDDTGTNLTHIADGTHDGAVDRLGHSRVQANESIRERWIAEMLDPIWLHGSADLSRALGYGS